MTWWDERSIGPLAAGGGGASEEKELSSVVAVIETASAAAAILTTAAEEEEQQQQQQQANRLPLATVDLEDPYLRDLVLEAFKSRSKFWRVERADGVPCEATREEEEEEPAVARREKGKDNEDEASSSSASSPSPSSEEEEPFDLLPHPLVSTSRFHWGEYERIDWDRVASGETMASSYAVRKGLTRKAQLAFGLKKWCSKRPQSPLVGCFPETHVLQVDDVDYIDEALCDLPEVRDATEGQARWIVKPSMTNRAAGIAVVDGCAGLRRALEAIPMMREWVVQRVYSFGGMLALSARSGYKDAPLDDLDAHLTNTCRKREQKKEKEGGGGGRGGDDGSESDNSNDSDCDGDDDDDRIMLLSEIPELLSQKGGGEEGSSLTLPEATEKTRRLAARISGLVAETFAAVSSELTFFAVPSAFELFGFDFLVDEGWDPWLLESNADPDVGASGGRLRGVIGEMVEGILRLTADELVVGEAEKREGEKASLSSSAEGGGGESSAGDDDGDDPLALKWRLVFERDSGREGTGFRVG